MKKIFIFGIVLLLIVGAGLAISGILLHSSKIDITINEALNVTSIDVSFNGYPGETFEKNITVYNQANDLVTILIDWTEDSNPNNVSYSASIPNQADLPHGETNMSIYWSVDSGSPVGIFNGTIAFTRI